MAIDLGRSGHLSEVTGTRRASVVVTADGLPVRVLVRADSHSEPSSNEVTVEFVPTPGAVVPHGAPCPIELQGAWWRDRSNDLFVVRTSRAPMTPFSFLLLGTKKLNVPLPPTQCPLRTDFPIICWITTSKGDHVARLVMPRLSGLTFHAQTIVAERQTRPLWRTSNGLSVRVP